VNGQSKSTAKVDILYTMQLFDVLGHGHPVLPLAVRGAAVHLCHEEVF